MITLARGKQNCKNEIGSEPCYETFAPLQLPAATDKENVMKVVLNLPPDLEKAVKKRAQKAGLNVPEYVLFALRTTDLDTEGLGAKKVSNEQFNSSLNRLRELHRKANPNFDDTRESIYDGCGE